MNEHEKRHPGWPVAAAALLPGPVGAALHEFGILSPGGASLASLLIVIVLAGAGLAVGGWVVRRSGAGALTGWLAVAANLVVLLFYGFLLVFFGLGGSR